MTQASFFGNYQTQSRLGFFEVQKAFFRSIVQNDPSFSLSIKAKKYVIEEQFFNGTTFDTRVYTLKGKLNTSLPFNQRKIRSVEFEIKDPNGINSARAKYTSLKNLNLEKFIDPGFDSIEKSFRGADVLTGIDNRAILLTGFRGDDEIILKSFNRAIGGGGKDDFILSKDTRDAQILDYNPNKDRLVIADDDPNNYRLVRNFGQFEILNQFNDIIATVNSFNDPDIVNQMATDGAATVDVFNAAIV